MPPKSKIITLPEEVKNYIDSELKKGVLSQGDITQSACEMLAMAGYDDESIFSVMSLNRYAKAYYQMMKTKRDAEQLHSMLIESNPDGNFDINDATVEQMKLMIIKEVQKYASGEKPFDIDTVNKLSVTLKRLSETEQKTQAIKKQARKEYREELATKLENKDKLKPKGISEDVAKLIKKEILGID